MFTSPHGTSDGRQSTFIGNEESLSASHGHNRPTLKEGLRSTDPLAGRIPAGARMRQEENHVKINLG